MSGRRAGGYCLKQAVPGPQQVTSELDRGGAHTARINWERSSGQRAQAVRRPGGLECSRSDGPEGLGCEVGSRELSWPGREGEQDLLVGWSGCGKQVEGLGLP